MEMVKIEIPDDAQSAKALSTLMRRGKVVCFPGNVYVVPEPALAVLNKLGIAYQELGRGGLDYAEKALRDSLAAQT
jgi:hypothetical protein